MRGGCWPRVRSAWARAAWVVVVGWNAGASGQTLNLGSAAEPRLGEYASAVVLAGQLRGEADGLPTDLMDASAVGRGVRLLAASLVEGGERAGRAGAGRVLLGRTLAGSVGVIEAVVEEGRRRDGLTPGGPGALDGATLAVVGADLLALLRGEGRDLEAIERGLRTALAPIVEACEAQRGEEGSALGGWVILATGERAGAYREVVSRLSAQGTPLSGPAVEALVAVDTVVQRAEGSRSFRRSALSLRVAVTEASGAAEPMPRWLGGAAPAVLASSFERGLVSLADASRRGQGLEELRRVGRLVRLVRQVDRLADDQAGRRAREALAGYIAVPPTNRELESQVLSAFERGLGLALGAGELPDERSLLRQLRPAWREFQNSARVACGRVGEVLPTLMNDSAALTDPGVLALFNGAAQALGEARGLLHLTWLVTGREEVAPVGDPVPLGQYQALAARLLALAQSASRSGTEADQARRLLASLAVDATAWRVLPGEAGLRAAIGSPDPAWTKATESREHDLLSLVERTREAYLANITQDQTLVERAALRARLAMLSDLLGIVEAVAEGQRLVERSSEAVSASASAMTLGVWAGWELSPQAQALASEGVLDALAQTVALALRGEDERARLRIAAMRRDMAAGLLPGRLALALSRLGVGAGGALDEIGLGGPDRAWAWMPVDRGLLAEYCRAASELPGIRLRRDDAQDRAVRAYLAMIAQDALAELEASERVR